MPLGERILAETSAAAGLETCHRPRGAKIAHAQPEKSKLLKRTYQEGRIPLHAVARAEFCYHSLQEDLPHNITPGAGLQLRR